MKKILVFVLTFAIMIGASSISAFAENDYFTITHEEPSVVELGEYEVNKIWVDLIPVYYVTPPGYVEGDEMKICIFLSGLSGNKESLVTTYAQYIIENGYTAVFFDHYMHGERANFQNPTTILTSTQEEVTALQQAILNTCFKNMYRYGWEILGNSSLDTLRVLDYFYDHFPVVESVMGGHSMGGDTSLVVAGIDERVNRILCIVTAPDWLRPGMHNLRENAELPSDPGQPDAKSVWYYDSFSPSVNLTRYDDGDIDVMFACGEVDTHINPSWVYTFRENVYRLNPQAGQKMGIWTNMGQGHVSPGQEDLHKLFAWLLSGTDMEDARYLTGDEQAWDREYYYTMETYPEGY
ncbi:MAG: hypothetical protein Q4D04_07610 [Clostridia bacterium]|nr:hypothetical protein [Clostridia bacterium]